MDAPTAAAGRGAWRATNRRRVVVLAALLAVGVVLGAAMLSTVLAAPAHLAVEPPPPPGGVEPRPQPPIGRAGVVDPADTAGPRSTRPEPVAHTRTGTGTSTRTPDNATAPGDTAPVNTAPASGSGTSSPAGRSTAQPRPSTPTTAAEPADPPGAGDSAGVYYKNCAKARKAGALPLFRGDPGYSTRLDKDGDGEACNESNGK